MSTIRFRARSSPATPMTSRSAASRARPKESANSSASAASVTSPSQLAQTSVAVGLSACTAPPSRRQLHRRRPPPLRHRGPAEPSCRSGSCRHHPVGVERCEHGIDRGAERIRSRAGSSAHRTTRRPTPPAFRSRRDETYEQRRPRARPPADTGSMMVGASGRYVGRITAPNGTGSVSTVTEDTGGNQPAGPQQRSPRRRRTPRRHREFLRCHSERDRLGVGPHASVAGSIATTSSVRYPKPASTSPAANVDFPAPIGPGSAIARPPLTTPAACIRTSPGERSMAC